MKKPTVAELMKKIEAMEAKIEELEARPNVVNHTHFHGTPTYWTSPPLQPYRITCNPQGTAG